jgi:predicted RNA-binding Zn ribbon-like protein
MKSTNQSRNQLPLLSDHPVLEFLNTLPLVDGELHDQLQTDADVLHTLTRLGWPTSFHGTGLLAAARSLREDLRKLVERRKAARPLDLAQLNNFLAQASSHLNLRQGKKASPALTRVWQHRSPQQALAPLAEAAADLLANADFHLIRRCESETCVLWFYDRTRSHRRRWCSMASCGNRHKVAAFRQRSSEA